MNTNSSFQIKNTNAYISIAFFQRIRENKLYETMIRKYRLLDFILKNFWNQTFNFKINTLLYYQINH